MGVAEKAHDGCETRAVPFDFAQGRPYGTRMILFAGVPGAEAPGYSPAATRLRSDGEG